MNASLRVSGWKGRDEYPASHPPEKMINELTSSAASVCRKSRSAPATIESVVPIQGVNKGATRIPKTSNAWELNKYPKPRIAPATNENTNNSYEGKARRTR